MHVGASLVYYDDEKQERPALALRSHDVVGPDARTDLVYFDYDGAHVARDVVAANFGEDGLGRQPRTWAWLT